MKRLCLILLVFPIVCFSQVLVSEDSINFHFTNILNQYRLNIGQVYLDSSLKPFSDHWSKYMYDNNYLGHGTDTNSWKERKTRFSNDIISENCIRTFDLNTSISFDGYKFSGDMNESDINYLKYVGGKLGSGTMTNEDVAWYIFLIWKNSQSHNEVLKFEWTDRYYMSCYMVGNKITVSYVGATDIYKIKTNGTIYTNRKSVKKTDKKSKRRYVNR